VSKTIQTRESGEIIVPFLATTALEAFWDTSRPMIFLGKWCLLPELKSFWEPLGGKIVSKPLADPENYYESCEFVNRAYEQALLKIFPVLNSIHAEKHSLRYWRILVGPWLYFFVNAVYRRYVFVQAALRELPEFETIGLSEESFVTPITTAEFVSNIEDDRYNLQIFTKILDFFDYRFLQKKSLERILISNDHGQSFIKDSIKKLYSFICNKVYSTFHKKRIFVIKNSFLEAHLEYRLMVKSLFKFLVDKTSEYKIPRVENDLLMRKHLQEIHLGDGKFDKLISNMIPDDFPQCFLESYKFVKARVNKEYPSNPIGIFSATSYYFDEVFKQWAARNAEAGTVILGEQHGGFYGYYQHHFNTDHEIKITDKYYTWGWDKNNYQEKIVPFVSTKLSGRKIIGADNKKVGILYTTSVPFRYRFFFGVDHDLVIKWRRLFVESLLPEMLNNLIIRVRPGAHDLFEQLFSNVKIDSWKNCSFLESLQNTRIFVTDNCGTTFLEALAANKPTIIFFNPGTNRIHETDEPYFENLRQFGILYDSPNDAAKMVNEIYHDVENWWNEPPRQIARMKFCERYARTSRDSLGDWAKELIKYID
jgi:putative transferase (TIGR04331 family)